MKSNVDSLCQFREVWLADFEFRADPGERPVPHCLVARELKSGRLVRAWLGESPPNAPPFATGADVLLVAYYASAEVGCYLSLGWPVPVRILDLFTEFRNLTNTGLKLPHGSGLLGALAYFGLPAIEAAEKDSMRDLAMRGGPFTDSERAGLLDYCRSDVDALTLLLPAMLPTLDLPRALLRGRYMAAAARMEYAGVPIDAETLTRLRTHWEAIKAGLIEAIDPAGEIYVPSGRHIDPATASGESLYDTAAEYSIEPAALAAGVDAVYAEEREAITEYREAIAAARKLTGITYRAASNWEDAGHDCASWPALDTDAQSLAREYPILGLGSDGTERYGSFSCDENPDHAGRLWAKLREPDPTIGRKFDSDRLRRAAELVTNHGGARWAGPRSFSAAGFAKYLARHRIAWPRLESGALDLSDDAFRDGAKLHPATIGPIRELRHALSQLRLSELAVGADGRNRCLLSAFQSKTGRNQPSNSRFIFGPAVWLRSLIRPELGRALAYIDWSSQEYGIAAALSGDKAMQADYASGDAYLAFGRRIGAVPADATKKTHGDIRDRLKVCVGLGALYGAGAETVAAALGVQRFQAAEWLSAHRVVYRRYWTWSDATLNTAALTGRMRTCFGWTLHVGAGFRGRSLRNFPMQAHGAEMMRLAAILATERGVVVAAPVHDAFLIDADADEIDAETERMQAIMREASELVLPGFPLRTDAKIVRDSDRYSDPRGAAFWDRVIGLLEAAEAAAEIDVSRETIPA